MKPKIFPQIINNNFPQKFNNYHGQPFVVLDFGCRLVENQLKPNRGMLNDINRVIVAAEQQHLFL